MGSVNPPKTDTDPATGRAYLRDILKTKPIVNNPIKGRIEVDTERCKGCEVCVVACPTQTLALGAEVNTKGYRPCYMAQPEQCIGCAACAMVCPDSCITVYRAQRA